MLPSVTEHLQAIVDSVRDHDSGELADYIDVLKHADPDKLALAMCTTDGHLYAVGDADYEFSIQSISKPFVYALALGMYGPEEVHAHVGVEPSGEAFNKLSLDDDGRPANTLINAGAITVNQLIGGPDMSVEQRSEMLWDYFSRLAGRELAVDQRVLVTVKDLAVMAATLAAGGKQPVTGERVVSTEAARLARAVMVSSGMYDASGQWMVNVGIPAKSGVAGGLIGTLPGQLGIASLSPLLNKQGNSVRGVKIFRELSSSMGLNMLSSNFFVAPGIRRIERRDDADIVELQGMINFTNAEKILRGLTKNRVCMKTSALYRRDSPNLSSGNTRT